MENDTAIPQAHPLERETEYEANRLIEHIQSALSAAAADTHDEGDSIEAAADRIERASHDLVFALRELARDRSESKES